MFRNRSHKKELLDEVHIPKDALHKNLRELEVVNKWLGGLQISLAGLKQSINNKEKIVLADIGCGGGDALKTFAQYAKKGQIDLKLIGIDLKQECIDYAAKYCKGYDVHFIKDDYRNAVKQHPEITHIHAALFCHHLTDNELVELLTITKKHNITLIINDLERHPIAYYSIYVLTRLFGGSYLVKNDAPLSVLRGFKKREWKSLLEKAGIQNYSISWRWAFRHLIVIPNHAN